MKKIKFLITSMLGAIALVFACVLGTRVNAANNTTNGSYVVSNNKKTATWNFSDNVPTSNFDISNGNGIQGIINTSSNPVTYKSSDKALSLPIQADNVSANIHIPVPSAESAGTISFTASQDKSARTMYLMHGDTKTDKSVSLAKSTSFTFTKDDLTLYNEHYYVRFDSIQDLTDNNKGDIKWKTISITLSSDDQFSVKQYTVTYDVDGETTSSSVDENSSITLNAAPSKAEDEQYTYQFAGWSDGESTYEAGESYTVTSNVTFTAFWNVIDKNANKVSFYSEGVLYSQSSISNGSVSMPINPTKNGYTFLGWLNEDGSSFVNSELSDNINVYANYSINQKTSNLLGDVKYSLTVEDVTDSSIKTVKTYKEFFTIAGADKKEITTDTQSDSLNDKSFTGRIKLGGTGTKSSRYISFTIDKSMDLVIYGASGSSSSERNLVLENQDGSVNENILVTKTIATNSKSLAAGTYYLYSGNSGFNVYGIYLKECSYTPNLSLSVDAKTELSKVRVVATIDNVDIDSSKVNGISSVVYTVYGATKTTNLPAAKLYTSIDFTDKGFYSQKNYTAYAVMVFSGYNSTNVTAAFDVKVTVTLSNDVVVEKTISVPAPAAPSNN